MIPRPYQREAVDSLHNYFVKNTGNPLVVMPTASGKSYAIALFIKETLEAYPDTRICIVTHVKELIRQNAEEFLKVWPEAYPMVGIHSAGMGRRDREGQIMFAGIQSIYKKVYELPTFHLIIVDECFISGTMVTTPEGERPIETLAAGETINTAFGESTITAVSKRESENLYNVRLSNGRTITCTREHPFFTDRGWVKTHLLEKGRRVYRPKDLSALWESVCTLEEIERDGDDNFFDKARAMEKAKVLFNILLQEARESNGLSGSERANGGYTQKNRPPSDPSWWKWAGDDKTATSSFEHSGERMDPRISCTHKNSTWEWLSNLLQIRFGKPRTKNRNRIRRKLSSGAKKDSRQKERFPVDSVWVEGVSRVKQHSARTVYNLQVSGHPSYFANGVLVHNCHLVPRTDNTMYLKFHKACLERNELVKWIGFTATHFRLDSGLLTEGDDRLFTDVCYEVGIKRLINEGYLCPLTTKATATTYDLKGVRVQAGDYVAAELESRMDKSEITQRAVAEIIAAGQDRNSWLVFCPTVAYAEHVAEEFERQGVPTRCVHGKLHKSVRDQYLAELKGQVIRCVVNCNVLTTGFNHPALDLIALLRPTKSAGLYVQMCGRAMRNAPGKANGLILDFAGVIDEHGPLDMVKPKHKNRSGQTVGAPPVKVCPNCQSKIFAGLAQCPDCGYEFPKETIKHEAEPTKKEIISSHIGEPTFWIRVESVYYSKHWKKDYQFKEKGKTSLVSGTPTLQVEYQCVDGEIYKEWVCVEHTGYAGQRADGWYLLREIKPLDRPRTVDEALGAAFGLKFPCEIMVKQNEKNPKYWSVTAAKDFRDPPKIIEPSPEIYDEEEGVPF